jgi:hypothetical protein
MLYRSFCLLHTRADDMQDVQLLDTKLTRPLLQALFRDSDLVKVGFGLEGDLKAIAAALGNEGGGCIAAVRSHVDVAGLHRHLLHSGYSVPRTSGPSLSGAACCNSLHGTLRLQRAAIAALSKRVEGHNPVLHRKGQNSQPRSPIRATTNNSSS